jgi:4-hydroxy-tetrahydrodipicolinate reductase
MQYNTVIGIYGASGKMGQAIIDANQEKNNGVKINYLYSRSLPSNNIDDLFNQCEVIIDFSSPECTSTLLQKAAQYNKKLLIGTTGISENLLYQIKEAGNSIPIFYSANVSVGVNVLAKVLKFVAAILNPEDYDIDILDIHHKHKKDAPSGTALMLGKKIAEGRGVDLEQVKVFNRIEKGAKKPGEIDFCSLRSGSEPGSHEVTFSSGQEVLSFKHKAYSRKLFAMEVLNIAMWLNKMPKGFYEMDDYIRPPIKD